MSPDEQPKFNPSPQETKPTIDMEAFRAEIAELVKKRGGVRMEMEMNLSLLNETDADMWLRVKNYTRGSVTREEFASYQEKAKKSNNMSRIFFAGTIIANRIAAIWGMEQLEDNK